MRRLALAVAATMALAVLTGCTDAGAQSKADACDLVRDGVAAVQSELAPLPDALADDDLAAAASAVGAALGKAGTTLVALQPRVTDPAVGAAVSDLVEALTRLGGAVASADDPTTLAADEAFIAANEDVAAAGKRFSALCEGEG